jgi:DUF2934 family protein
MLAPMVNVSNPHAGASLIPGAINCWRRIPAGSRIRLTNWGAKEEIMPKPTKESSQPAGESQAGEVHPTRLEIEQRAYEIYVERGYTQGGEMENWLQAERELQEKYSKKGTAAKATAS